MTFDPDVASALERLRREKGIGLSQAANDLIREGLKSRPDRPQFKQTSHAMGLKIDVSNVSEALDLLEGPTNR